MSDPACSSWICLRCTFQNPTDYPMCEMCDAVRPRAPTPAVLPSTTPSFAVPPPFDSGAQCGQQPPHPPPTGPGKPQDNKRSADDHCSSSLKWKAAELPPQPQDQTQDKLHQQCLQGSASSSLVSPAPRSPTTHPAAAGVPHHPKG
eukprot:gnl/Spiro4/2808_TR1368_c0_g1_i1.p2 gnl/Spiro4/2808_TR1368_c0_g1~~gnl/Spiro4/2808_TR1368_c0_g1_i1.p2  ORF type:complete len:146 (+),score=9.16 gnl/Spiro4/2808_TR1368_c0_g1_i1:71-508(+)